MATGLRQRNFQRNGQEVQQVNVTYKTGIRSNIVGSHRQLCDGDGSHGQSVTLASPIPYVDPSRESFPIPKPPFSINENEISQLYFGEVSIEDVENCLSTVHSGPRPFISFKLGDELPANILIASNLGNTGSAWTQFPVTPICHNGSRGLFRSNGAFFAPYEGAYWQIVP